MKKVLLIEDDTILRENTAELLELSDYKVLTAANGKIGVELAKSNLPDIIICDIMMEVMDGYEVLKTLSKGKKTKYIPFIFLSAKTERKDIRKGMDLGADDYITKPFNEDELTSAIESRLAKVAILKDRRNEEESFNSTNELKNFFESYGSYITVVSGNDVYTEGDNSNYVYLIKRGVIKSYKLDGHGKELTTELYNAGDIFGYSSFSQNIPYQETATALKNTELIGITKNEFKNMLNNNPNIALELLDSLTDNLSHIKAQLLQMAYSSVDKKTAATILQFAEKLNPKPEDPIKISRSDLASVAGIASETLIRTMSNFKKQGIIEIEGRNIKILDIEKLQHID